MLARLRQRSVPCIVISPDATKAAKAALGRLHSLTVVGSPACTSCYPYIRQPDQMASAAAPLRRALVRFASDSPLEGTGFELSVPELGSLPVERR
jgi:hypothetical protein